LEQPKAAAGYNYGLEVRDRQRDPKRARSN
jgi:hypothetical protein